jgi:hypothetical protein
MNFQYSGRTFHDLHAASWATRRLQIVRNFLNIYMTMFRKKTVVEKNENNFMTKFPSYVNATIFKITNPLKSKPGQSHVTAGGQSVFWYRVSSRAYDQISI